MFCPFCRTALPDGSKFCPSCGKSIPAAPASPMPNLTAPTGAPAPGIEAAANDVSQPQVPPTLPRPGALRDSQWPDRTAMPPPVAIRESALPEGDPRSRTVLLMVAALLALLLVVLGLWLFGRSRGSVVEVRSTPMPRGPSIVKSPAALPSGPSVAAQPAQPRGMPEDIRRYLSFLQGVEAQRKQYEGQLTNRMLAVVPTLLMPNFDNETVKPPDQQMVQQYGQMAQEYAQATMRFQTASQGVTVPLACRKLHADYSTALSLNPRLINETARRLGAGDYTGLLTMRGTIGKTIEQYYQAADQELANICNQYGIRKPFDIGNSGGGESVLLP